MTLIVPTYIASANPGQHPIAHTWNEDLFYEFAADQRLANRIRPICPRGAVALGAGCAEWIAWRLRPYLDDHILLHYVEAVWAGIVDWRYLRRRNDVPGAPYYLTDWDGPVRGPVIMAFNFLDEVIAGAKKPMTAGGSCASLTQLGEYVMVDEEPYKEWRRFAIQRLANFCPLAGENDPGPPLPREVLDPTVDYQPEMAAELIARFLATLDPARNPFLKTADEMITEGFKGTPYAS